MEGPFEDVEGTAAFVVDSLPYIDDYDENYDQYAASLIEEEMKTMKPRSNPKFQSSFQLRFPTPLLKHEYQQVARRRSSDGITEGKPEKRPKYSLKLVPPLSSSSSDGGDDVEAWEQAVRRARIELEKERIRGMMLEIEKEGITADQWKDYNDVLEQSLQYGIEPVLEKQRQQVDNVNLNRQEHQDKVGNQLEVLGSQYQQLVEKVYQLKRAVATLEAEIESFDK